jgi:2-oxoglutarate dehydrogenase E2 component (dihydrolipoamide succinyltransferase)
MSVEIRVPQLPESVADATLVAWHKQPGESVSRDENLADLETDKVVLEVPAPTNGVIREIKIQSGATVTSGQVLAVIEEGATAAATPKAAATAAAAASAGPAPASKVAESAEEEGGKDAGKLSPAVRRLVEENGLDPAAIPASGRDGRLTKSDVVEYLDKQKAAGGNGAAGGKAAAAASVPAQGGNVTSISAKAPASKPSTPSVPTGRSEQRVPMTRLRQRIASRLIEAQHSAALLSTFNEVDLTAVNELRARYKDRFEKQHGVKLGFMSFFVKASVEALKKFPVVNATIDGTDIVYHEYYDIGVAVSTDRGLMVPIVRDADLKSFAEIEKEINAYATKARDGTIGIDDLTGGTFTITNGGIFGSLLSTPIVNAPQSAILGMHKIQERPIAVNGEIKIRPMMYLAVSYDHRLIDGREAVQFLVAIKDALEDPGRMLLGL